MVRKLKIYGNEMRVNSSCVAWWLAAGRNTLRWTCDEEIVCSTAGMESVIFCICNCTGHIVYLLYLELGL